MTAEMPSTKPNIIITARLLLMPVLRSVELKPCAKTEGALRMRNAATAKAEESRERTLDARLLVNFITLMLCCFFLSSAALPPYYAHTTSTNAPSEDVCDTQNASKSLLRVRDEQNDGLGEAHQAPRTELSLASRNPRPDPRPATNHFRGATRRTWSDQTSAPAWKLSAARTNRSWEDRNGRRDNESSVRVGKAISVRHVRISKPRGAWVAARRASWRSRIPGRGA